jgi:tetratricopeptide (TPR) repeat protein
MKNTLSLLFLLFLIFSSFNAYPQKKEEKKENFDNKVLEERINSIKKEIDYKIEVLKSNEDIIKQYWEEKHKWSYEYQRNLFWIVSVFLTLLLAIISIMFKKGIVDYAREITEKKAEDATNYIVTSEYVDGIIGKKGDEKIKEKINQFDDLLQKKVNDFDKSLKDKVNEFDILISRLKELEPKIMEDNFNQGNEISKEQENNVKEYVDITEKLKDEDKFTAKDWYLKGYDEYIKENFNDSIKFNTKAIDLKPDYFQAYNIRGLVYSNIGEYEKAIKDFDKTIELNIDFAAAYNNKGLTYSRQGIYGEAIDLFNKSKKLAPNVPVVYINLTRAYLFNGEYNEALNTIDSTKKFELDNEDKAIFKYYECILNKILSNNTNTLDKEFDEIMKEDFKIKFTSNFDVWLNKVDIPTNTKKYIQEKIELLKKKNHKYNKNENQKI